MKIGEQISNIKIGIHHPYREKDIRKFAQCNKLIARGVAGSSSAIYAQYCDNVNCNSYDESDVVGVSVNGWRSHRQKFNSIELSNALLEQVTIVTDTLQDRLRQYNIGEREVADYLLAVGYQEVSESGVWRYGGGL